jgi:hypothetical protein
MRIQDYKSDRAVDVDNYDDDRSDFVGDYVMHEDEEITRFGDTIATRYRSQYERGDRSIDTMYGFRREACMTFMIGYSPLSVEENGDITVLEATYEGTEGL